MILDGDARKKFKYFSDTLKKKKGLLFFKILNIEISIRIQGGHSCPRNWNVPSAMPISLSKETRSQGTWSYVPIARSPSN
jgi:hypothetical protein